MNLSQFINNLDRQGELIKIKAEVSTDLEIAEITDRQCKAEGGGKALLFENNGTKFPVITNMMGSMSRLHNALRVDSLYEIEERIDKIFADVTSPKKTFLEKLAMLPTLKQVAGSMPKHSSKKGECQQCEIEPDLSLLPILKCAPHDGGKFVTLPLVHTVDPDSGQQNVGMYRMQVFEKNTTGMHWHKHKTGANHYQKYKERGQKMPIVVCLGGDPLYTYCATAPLPEGIDEYILAGFLRQKPVKLVKCLTCDIEVPEDVDFVIEGYVDPAEELVTEGDFGDHTGFYSLTDLYPKFHVTKITHRKDAVYPATIVGVPPMEDFYFALASERIFLKPIQMVIAPEVVDVWMPMEGVAHNIVVTTIKKRYDGQAFKVASALWGAGQMSFNKFCIIVDDSRCDLSPLERVMEGLKGVDFRRDCTTVKGVLDVLDHAAEKSGYGGKMCIDLTCGAENEKLRDQFKFEITHDLNTAKNADAIIVVDKNVPLDSPLNVVVWLVAANCDPSRDVIITHEQIIIDGRAKIDKLSRHPNIVCANIDTIELVDKRWNEYQIGHFIQSPSLKLLPLQFSDSATIER